MANTLAGFTPQDIGAYLGNRGPVVGSGVIHAYTQSPLTPQEKYELQKAGGVGFLESIRPGIEHLYEHPKGSHYHGDFNAIFDDFTRALTGLFTLGASEIPVNGDRLGVVTRAEPFVSTVATGGLHTTGTKNSLEQGIFSISGKVVSALAVGAASLTAPGGLFSFTASEPVAAPAATGIGQLGPVASQPDYLPAGFYDPAVPYASQSGEGVGVLASGKSIVPLASSNGFAIPEYVKAVALGEAVNEITQFFRSSVSGAINSITQLVSGQSNPGETGTPGPSLPGTNIFNYAGGGGGSGFLPGDSGNLTMQKSSNIMLPIVLIGVAIVALVFFLKRK